MAEGKTTETPQRLTRREFLKGAIEKGAGLAVLAVVGCGTNPKVNIYPTPEGPKGTSKTETGANKAQFNFGEDVSENLRGEIRNGVDIGVDWLLKKTGVNIQGLSVHAYGSLDRVTEEYFKRRGNDTRTLDQIRRAHVGSTAFAGDRKNFYVITTSPGWISSSPIIQGPIVEGRYHTVFHELYHVLQWEVNGYAGPPPVGWLNEGGAHYIAARALDENTIGGKKIYPYEEIKARHLKLARSSANFLQSMDANFGGDYSLAFMAMDLLLKDKSDGGVGALTTYWKEIGRGRERDEAFSAAFNKKRADFYAEFEAYRARGFQ